LVPLFNIHQVPLLFSFEDTEGFAGEIWGICILGIEDIAKLITGKAINTYLFKPDPKFLRALLMKKLRAPKSPLTY